MKNGPVKILLIEDNPDDARLMELMLRDAKASSFELERVDRLSKGLERIEQGGIAAVLLDLSLPDSRGWETFSKVHTRAPQVPIIVLSGLDDEDLALKTVQEGAQDYLIKGQVDGRLLVRAMRYAIERKRVEEALRASEQQIKRYAVALRERNEQMQADLQLARDLQLAFLPQQYPTFPSNATPNQSALRFHHRYLPTGEVGGDFFNVLALSETEVGVFVCDVMGHGVRSALVTAILRGLVEELTNALDEPGRFLTEINRSMMAILKRTSSPMFASAFYMVADVTTGKMRYAIAGHPSPMLLRRGAEKVELICSLDCAEPALGLFEENVYITRHHALEENDSVMLFTDGLFEVEGGNGDFFGQERLLAFVQRNVGLPTRQLFEEVLSEIRNFSGNNPFADDVCLVGMDVVKLKAG